jgi:hypothetical protein
MKIEKITDYALPCMHAEHALKEAHSCMLDRHYDDALYECTQAITYVANMMEAIKEMKARDK